MTLRVVAIPLIAAICLGSPAMASPSTDDDQQVKGRGARDRSGNSGGTSSGGASGRQRNGGDNQGGNRTTDRSAERRGDGDKRAASGSGDRDAEPPRYAVPRDPNQGGYRDSGQRNNPPIVVNRHRPDSNGYWGSPYRGPGYYAPVHYDRWARSYYHWSPIGYVPWGLIAGSIGFANFSAYSAYGGAYGALYAPGYGYDFGGVRLKIRPRDAQVFVDGHYAGLVDDFDGTFQSLRLEQGGHKIEIHMPGFEDLELDVHVQPGKTLTLSETLRPRP